MLIYKFWRTPALILFGGLCFLLRKIQITSLLSVVCLALCWGLHIHYFRLKVISIFTLTHIRKMSLSHVETCPKSQLVNRRAWIWLGRDNRLWASVRFATPLAECAKTVSPGPFFYLSHFSGLFMQLLILRNEITLFFWTKRRLAYRLL